MHTWMGGWRKLRTTQQPNHRAGSDQKPPEGAKGKINRLYHIWSTHRGQAAPGPVQDHTAPTPEWRDGGGAMGWWGDSPWVWSKTLGQSGRS